MNRDYVKRLEDCIMQMMTPLKGVPFNLVMEKLTGYRVLPFIDDDDEDAELLAKLKTSIARAGQDVNMAGIRSRRANEVGNYIEPYVRDALTANGLAAEVPVTANGRQRMMGYPDIQITYAGHVHYVECKTYNVSNFDTTQRSFYFSPSDEPKVTADAHHFLVSFQVYVQKVGSKNVYKCRHWRILTLDSLSVDVKYEFNSDNRRLYGDAAGARTLAEGEL